MLEPKCCPVCGDETLNEIEDEGDAMMVMSHWEDDDHQEVFDVDVKAYECPNRHTFYIGEDLDDIEISLCADGDCENMEVLGTLGELAREVFGASTGSRQDKKSN